MYIQVLSRASSFDRKRHSPSSESDNVGTRRPSSVRNTEMKTTRDLRRVSSLRGPAPGTLASRPPTPKPPSPLSNGCPSVRPSSPIAIQCPQPETGDFKTRALSSSETRCSGSCRERVVTTEEGSSSVSRDSLHLQGEGSWVGVSKVNTLWGLAIQNCAKMCIPDLDVLVEYPIDYKFPVFVTDESGECVQSGFFPGDPIILHHKKPSPSPVR